MSREDRYEKHPEDPRVSIIPAGNDYAGWYGPGFVIGRTRPGHCGHNRKIFECPFCWPVEPALVEEHGHQVERHPAYGQIALSRAQSTGYVLHGSPFRHQALMRITIRRSAVERSMSNDHYFPRETLIEVELSEAQWATFISSPGAGSGVPCTISHLDGQPVSRIPEPRNDRGAFTSDIGKTLVGARERLAKLRERIEAGRGGKESLSLVSMVDRDISSSLDFVVQQFERHMEQVVEAAKVEINAYATRLGVKPAEQPAIDGPASAPALDTGEPS